MVGWRVLTFMALMTIFSSPFFSLSSASKGVLALQSDSQSFNCIKFDLFIYLILLFNI
jgi:hypothetical protein